MKFILFRHAQKGVTPFEDPELTPKGFEQSAQILNLVKDSKVPAPTSLLVSPKRRTSQTLYPLAKEYGLDLNVSHELDLRTGTESLQDFRLRITHFLNSLSENHRQKQIIFACTHYDWIEEAMTLINCDKDLNTFEFSHWAPAQFAAFEVTENTWHFINKS